jgi:hypothetical protein
LPASPKFGVCPNRLLPGKNRRAAANWKWVAGIVLGLIMGFVLARILSRKPLAIVPHDEKDAVTRSRGHQRFQNTNPASRAEKQISKELNQDFMQGPMRQTAPERPASAPRTEPPARPAAATNPPVNKPKPASPKPAKPARSMPDTPALPPTPEELIDADATLAPAGAAPAPAAAPAGPVQFYAPAPEVPSIEHRKLSPNPLPQMPLLIKLAHPDATRAEFSFSPQADQSRIIGNGVRELKEFFAFELPPTEQFTTIKNLAPGKLEKRDDTWHVVQKASIALS